MCDDGTVWVMTEMENNQIIENWRQLPEIPQPQDINDFLPRLSIGPLK